MTRRETDKRAQPTQSPAPVRYRDCCFFQAEDGIRDLTVTGVQTCALPILDHRETFAQTISRQQLEIVRPPQTLAKSHPPGIAKPKEGGPIGVFKVSVISRHAQIGRASGRERV